MHGGGKHMATLTNLVAGVAFAAASLAPMASQDAHRMLSGQPLLQVSGRAGAGRIAPLMGEVLSAARAELPHLFSSVVAHVASESR
jgi:hypothetical protein